jgi:hypothetical protein
MSGREALVERVFRRQALVERESSGAGAQVRRAVGGKRSWRLGRMRGCRYLPTVLKQRK